MMKIGIIGDMHWGVKNGNPDFLEFQKFWLEDALSRMQKLGIDTIIQTGDHFDTRAHIKLNVLHAMIHWFPDVLRNFGIKKWITYGGNHDMFYRDSNEICALDIFSLMNHGLNDKFIIVKDKVEILNFGGVKLAIAPWINKNNNDRILSEIAKSKADYLFGHFEMIGMPMIPGFLCDSGVDPKSFKDFKRVISGHFHTVSNSLNCTMVGTPYHITWGDVQDGDNRGFWTLDLDTDELVLHKNESNMTLFSVIEYDSNAKYEASTLKEYAGTIAKILVKEKPDAKHFKKFTDLLNGVGFIDFKIIDTTMVQIDKVEISEEALSLDTLSAMNAYIDAQGNDIKKDKVKSLAKQIYIEVLNGGQ
jgi:DNA repair exonuclease SbcCD nuclease subunit